MGNGRVCGATDSNSRGRYDVLIGEDTQQAGLASYGTLQLGVGAFGIAGFDRG